jgi:Kef-type K+ transport system membrane component KefB
VSRPIRALFLYGALAAGAAAAFVLIATMGAGLKAPAPPGPPRAIGPAPGAPQAEVLVHVLLALAAVILFSRVVGMGFRRLGQPAVIGEIVAGIMLGPSLLGRVAPGLSAFILPPSVSPYLALIAQVGIIIYMFLVGMELDKGLLRERTHATVLVSHASIIVPFVLGSALALHLYPSHSTSDVHFTAFALFLGVSMSVTAFPVLARILTDRGIQRTRLGVLALSCAAVDDVTAWCLLAFLVSFVQAQPGNAVWTVGMALAFLAAMFLLARPAIHRLVRAHGDRGVGTGVMTAVCVGMLLSALVTEYVGIHAIFGAFLLGTMFPSGSPIARELKHKLEDLVVVLFLPAYFAFTGMRTQIGLLSGAGDWLVTGLIILVASAGKFGGSALAARATGSAWREAASIGVLMNTRGLMELVVLNIGLDLGVLAPTLFTMMVIMALVTTLATAPLLHLLSRGGTTAAPRAEAAAAGGVGLRT